ncbi:unnamed protein product (mitochondrion) [Plasmodiophora brassicae]|uniref:Uncharacterized protein n=1 Tax=Plasmodiophora brassicae TaxID=37360 RepID=A0A0G4IST0_PLABS|nr:hypothetical protein PBRA_006396 [Plasmodiophora brassicae]SPQ95144.1 unnamed protein product [Plasmodiophora brassicae]
MRVFQVLRGLFRPAAPAGDDPFKRTIWGTVKRYKQELWIIGAMSAALSMSMRLVAQKHQHQAVVSDLQGAVDELQALSGRQRQALDTIEAAVESGTVNDVRAAIEDFKKTTTPAATVTCPVASVSTGSTPATNFKGMI